MYPDFIPASLPVALRRLSLNVAALACCGLLAACAQPRPPAAVSAPPAPEVVLPAQPLTSDLLYEFLVTEIAAQRGHKELAAEGGMDLAGKTGDPRLARRAAQLALDAGDLARATEALQAWRELEPDALLPKRMLLTVLLRQGNLAEAGAALPALLQAEPDKGAAFMQLVRLLNGAEDKAGALTLMQQAAEPYADLPEAQWGISQRALVAGDRTLALQAARRASALRPDWQVAVLQEAQLLLPEQAEAGLAVLERYLKRHPDAREVRLFYARALLGLKHYEASRTAFRTLAEEKPDDPELAFAIALISMQMGDTQAAEAELQRALEKGKQDTDAVSYYLGQLAEAREDEAAALKYYQAVLAGDYRFAAGMRVSYLLGKQGRLNEARDYLAKVQTSNPHQAAQHALVEAQLMREQAHYKEAYAVLQKALKQFPENGELLYEAAMMADRLGHFEPEETLLRKLIELEPDNAHAYNALGYSLLVRNVRVPEALALVEKALAMRPEDAAIMDSVGWGYFRSGRMEESVAMLRRAYEHNADPEIAAHLGEVLWQSGRQDEARTLLQDMLRKHPDHAQLREVMKRYSIQ